MSGDRARQRNLKNQIGETAAAAVVEMRDQVRQIAMSQRVLATQMLDFERTVATVRSGRAADRAFNEGVQESQGRQLDALRRSMEARSSVANDGFELLLSQLTRFESMTFWQRLRWNFTGALPPIAADADTPEPVIADGSDGAYPGDGL